VEVVASLSQGRTAAAQCGLFTHKSVPVIFEPPCRLNSIYSTSQTHNTKTTHLKAKMLPTIRRDKRTDKVTITLQSGLYMHFSPSNPQGGSAWGWTPPTHWIFLRSSKYLNSCNIIVIIINNNKWWHTESK